MFNVRNLLALVVVAAAVAVLPACGKKKADSNASGRTTRTVRKDYRRNAFGGKTADKKARRRRSFLFRK